jgi:putative hydrolase
MHTVASGHAFSTVTEYAAQARERGLKLIAITDHGPAMPGGTHEFYFSTLRMLPSHINGVEILRGVELNIMDERGGLDLPESILKKMDIRIASLHLPCFPPASCEKNTQAVVNAIAHPLVQVIGHPCDPRYPLDIDAVVSAARDHNKVLELNNASFDPETPRRGGEAMTAEMLSFCEKYGVPIIVNSDAHIHYDVGVLNRADTFWREQGFPERLVLNWSLDGFKRVLGISG